MAPSQQSARHRARSHSAVFFEGGLTIAALALAGLFAWWLRLPLWERVTHDWNWTSVAAALGRGTLATAPLLASFFALVHLPWPPMIRLRNQMERAVSMLLGGASLAELALVSGLAGFGEELLFRGVLQPVAAHWLTPSWGLLVASLLFGLAHYLSVLYFLLATLVGLYFGWLTDRWDDVLAPAVAHGLYDFVALVYVLRGRQKIRRPDPSESDRL